MILECRKGDFTVMASVDQPKSYQEALDAATAHERAGDAEHVMIRQHDKPHDLRGYRHHGSITLDR